MAPPVLHRVIWGSQTPPTPAHASLLSIRPAILHAHQRRKVAHADYPAVIPAAGCEVRGTLVQGLTDGDIWRLDIFEGSEYARRPVRVRVLEAKGRVGDAEHGHVEGEEVDAQTYVWTAGVHRLEAAEWDFEHFVAEKMARWVGREAEDEGFRGALFSVQEGLVRMCADDCVDVDDAVAALQDPTGGRGANGDISRRLESDGKMEEKVLESAV